MASPNTARERAGSGVAAPTSGYRGFKEGAPDESGLWRTGVGAGGYRGSARSVAATVESRRGMWRGDCLCARHSTASEHVE